MQPHTSSKPLIRHFIHLLLCLSLLVGFLPASAQSQQPTPQALVRIDLRTPAERDLLVSRALPIYALLDLHSGQVALAALDAASQAELAGAGLPVQVLDPAFQDPGDYQLAWNRDPSLASELANLAQVLADFDGQVLVRAAPAQLAQIERLGLRLAGLSAFTLQPQRTGTALAPQVITPDPIIQTILNRVQTGDLILQAEKLSGEVPVIIEGSPYTILTRWSRSDVPIQRATRHVHDVLSSFGLETAYHYYNLPGTGERRNVLAEQPGLTQPDKIVLIVGHMDSTSQTPATYAPGADDNASGTTAVLAAARQLHQLDFAYTIRYVLFTGEEQGLYGSAAYAAWAASQGHDIVAVLNLDMIAYDPNNDMHFDVFVRPSNIGDMAIAQTFTDVNTAYNINLAPTIIQQAVSYSDHYSFWVNGYNAVLGIEEWVNGNPYYHTVNDRVSTYNQTFFTRAVKTSVGTIAHLAGLLDGAHLTGAVTDAWTGFPLTGVTITATGTQMVKETVTNLFGAYELFLPSGDYNFTLSADGYYPLVMSNIPVDGAQTLNFTLEPAFAELSGTVTEVGNVLPVTGAAITVENESFSEVFYTDANGDYAGLVPRDLYTVTASAPGFMSATVTDVDLDTPQVLDFELARADAEVNGYVTRFSDGSPIVGALVLLENGTQSLTVTTGADGYYQAAIVSGTYTLTASAPDFTPFTRMDVEILEEEQVDFSLCQALRSLAWSSVPGAPLPEETVTFSALLDGGESPFVYTWEFGDGNDPLSGPEYAMATYSYADPGGYTVTLSISDACPLPTMADYEGLLNVLPQRLMQYIPLITK
jgi:hypothetical protein